MIIIDRRKNPKNKSLSNRRRFMERVKSQVKASAKKAVGQRSINDTGGANINVSGGITEDRFYHDSNSGSSDYVIVGNDRFRVGDKIMKQNESSSSSGAGRGDPGLDEFEFAISYDEFLNVIFDGLELPNLNKVNRKDTVVKEAQRAGRSTTGVASNLNIEHTVMSGLMRRLALRNPKLKKIKELEEEYKTATEERRVEILEEISVLKRRALAVSFLDDIDLRYNNWVFNPKPASQAVMFCVMDVSFSMEEEHKIIAKKFFLLVNYFLKRQYKNVEVVFVRHHSEANICDEDTFYKDRTAGGTLVSPAYEVVLEEIRKKYNPNDWNIYVTQVSDGDNEGSEEESMECVEKITQLMKKTQYMMYLEVRPESSRWSGYSDDDMTVLSSIIDPMTKKFPEQILWDRVTDESQIVPTFRKFFTKKGSK